MRYGDVFKNLDIRTIRETRKLIDNGIWKSEISIEEKIEFCREWLVEVSRIYKIKPPELIFKDSEDMYRKTGGGQYFPSERKIYLYKKLSLVTFLHEFRHHLQSVAKVRMYRYDAEHDARAWSTSLYKTVAPESYERAIENRSIVFY